MALIDPLLNLRAFLLADGAVNAAVGGVRVHVMKLPQAQRTPSVVFSMITEGTDHHMQAPSGYVQARVQVDSWADNMESAMRLALLVKERMDGFRGSWPGSGSPANPDADVQGVFSDAARHHYDSDANMYRASRDFFVNYGER